MTVYDSRGDVVAERVFEPGADVTLGADATAALVVPGWTGPPLLLLAGTRLHLGPGMLVHMAHDRGEDRVLGTLEELTAAGYNFPLELTMPRLNVTVRRGLSVIAHYLPEDA